jgi:hypothetical protein
VKRMIIASLLAACGPSAEVEVYDTAGGEVVVSANTNAPPPVQAEVQTQVGYAGRTGSGRSQEDPVSACGPRDSYAFVAAEFQCPEGGNPLGGDPSAGGAARVGNVGANSTGHIIDLYRVPCGSGPVDVYVDMYGCPEMSQKP